MVMVLHQKDKGVRWLMLVHKNIFQMSVKSDPGLHRLCFTSVCDCKTKINCDLFAPELLRFYSDFLLGIDNFNLSSH